MIRLNRGCIRRILEDSKDVLLFIAFLPSLSPNTSVLFVKTDTPLCCLSSITVKDLDVGRYAFVKETME